MEGDLNDSGAMLFLLASQQLILCHSHRIYGQSLDTFVLFMYNLFTIELKTFEGQKDILLYHRRLLSGTLPHLQMLVILSQDHHTLPISCTLACLIILLRTSHKCLFILIV